MFKTCEKNDGFWRDLGDFDNETAQAELKIIAQKSKIWPFSAQISGFVQLRMLCIANFLSFLHASKLTSVCNSDRFLSVKQTFN